MSHTADIFADEALQRLIAGNERFLTPETLKRLRAINDEVFGRGRAPASA